MSFSDTRLDGSGSCSSTQCLEADSSDDTSKMSMEVSSEDAPCIEAEESSSATAILCSQSTSLTSQVSQQSLDNALRRSTEFKVSTSDIDNCFASTTGVDREASYFVSASEQNEPLHETWDMHKICTQRETLCTRQPDPTSALACCSTESALIDAPMSVNPTDCLGQTIDSHDTTRVLGQVDSFSDTSKRARIIIEKDFGAGLLRRDVQSGTSSDSLSTCCILSDPALFVHSNMAALDMTAEQDRSRVSDSPVPVAHLVDSCSFPAQGNSGTNVDLSEESFETHNKSLQLLPEVVNADEICHPEDEVKGVQSDVVSKSDEGTGESNETPHQPERIDSRILQCSSAELSTILGIDPPNHSSAIELEGRKLSFSKMMDSAQSFRPLADCVNEAVYSGQTSIRNPPFGIQSAFGSQRLAAGTAFSSSELNAQPNSAEQPSSLDGSFHQIREAQLQARDSLLAAIHLANRLPLPAAPSEESQRSPHVHFSEHVTVSTFSCISPSEQLLTTESQLLANPMISELSDRYTFQLSDEGMPQEAELSSKSAEEDDDELANFGSDQQGYSSQYSVSNWLQSYLFDTDSGHSLPCLMRKSSSDVLKASDIPETTSLGIIAHRLQQMLSHTACDKSVDSGVPMHEIATDSSAQPSLANISAMLERLLQKDGVDVLPDKGSSQELDNFTDQSVVSLDRVGLLFDELLKSLTTQGGVTTNSTSDELLLSSGVTTDSYFQYALDTYHAFRRYAVEQKLSLSQISIDKAYSNGVFTETSGVKDHESGDLISEQRKALSCKDVTNYTEDSLNGRDGKMPMTLADKSDIGPSLSNITDFLMQALRQKQSAEASKIFLQKPSSNLYSAESELATIGSLLQTFLRNDGNEQTTIDPNDTVFILDMNSGSASVYKSPEDAEKCIVGSLFECLISQTSSSESSTDKLIHQKICDAFLMFRRYLSSSCSKGNKNFVKQDSNSSESSEEDRHDVENFLPISNKDQNCDQYVILENVKPSVDVKKQTVKGTISAPIETLPDDLKNHAEFEQNFHSAKQDLHGLGTNTGTCTGLSPKLSPKKNASEKNMKSSVKKGSSQSLPGISSIKVEIEEKSDSAETIRARNSTPVQRDPRHTRTASVSSGSSTLSTKDSLPGYASPVDILKTKQLQKVQAIVSHGGPGTLEKPCDCTANIQHRPCCNSADTSVMCTQKTIKTATENQVVVQLNHPVAEHNKIETRKGLQLTAEKERGIDLHLTAQCSQEPQRDQDSEITPAAQAHHSLSEESSISDISHASSIVDIVLRNLSEKMPTSNASISSDTVSASIHTNTVSEVEQENVRTDSRQAKEITSEINSSTSDTSPEKNVKQYHIEESESSRDKILAIEMTSFSGIHDSVADQTHVNDSSVVSKFVESNEPPSSEAFYASRATCMGTSQVNAAKCTCISLPAKQVAAPSAAVPQPCLLVKVPQEETLHDKPSVDNASNNVMATVEESAELSITEETMSTISSFSCDQDSQSCILQKKSRSETLSEGSSLSFLGHLATSELLRREYDEGSTYDESTDMIVAETNDRRDTFSQVQSDQTEYSLNEKYRLQVEKHHYSSSEPQVSSAVSPSISSDVQWSFRSSDFPEGDGQSSEGNETENDPLDGWVDMVGGHGDDEVPELELMGEDVRFLFNVPVAAETDESSSSDSEDSGYTPPVRDVRQNHAIADGGSTSNTVEMTDDDNMGVYGTAFSQNVPQLSLSQQSTGPYHEDSRDEIPAVSRSQTVDDHVLETIQPVTDNPVITMVNSERVPDADTPNSSVAQVSGDSLNVEAGSTSQGNRFDNLPDGRSTESCFSEKALNDVIDSQADDQAGENTVHKEMLKEEESVGRNPAREAKQSSADLNSHLDQGTPGYLCKRNQSVEADVTSQAIAELKTICPDLRLDPIGCSSENILSFRITRNPCFGPSSESLDEEIVPCCVDSFVNSYQNELVNQLECVSPSTSLPIRPPRSSKLHKLDQENLGNNTFDLTQLPSCSKDSGSMENLHKVASALVENVLQRSIAEMDESLDDCISSETSGHPGRECSSQCSSQSKRTVKTDLPNVNTSREEPPGEKNALHSLMLSSLSTPGQNLSNEIESIALPVAVKVDGDMVSAVEDRIVNFQRECWMSPDMAGMAVEARCVQDNLEGMENVSHSTSDQSPWHSGMEGERYLSCRETSGGNLSGEAEMPNSSVFIMRDGIQMKERSTQTTEAWEQDIPMRHGQILLQHRYSQTTDGPERNTEVWLQHVAEPAQHKVFQGSTMLPSVLETDASKLEADLQVAPDVLKRPAEKKLMSSKLQTADSTSFISRCFDARPHSHHVPLPMQRPAKMKTYLNLKGLNARANVGSSLSDLPTQRPECTTESREPVQAAATSHKFIQPQSISSQVRTSTANCSADVASPDTQQRDASDVDSVLYPQESPTIWQGSLRSDGDSVAPPVIRPFSCDGTTRLALQTTEVHSEEGRTLNQSVLQANSCGSNQPSVSRMPAQDFAGLSLDSINTRLLSHNDSLSMSTASQTIHTTLPSDLCSEQVGKKEVINQAVDESSLSHISSSGGIMMGTFKADFGCSVHVCDRSSAPQEVLDFSNSQMLKVQVMTPTKNKLSVSSNTEGSTELCLTVSYPHDSPRPSLSKEASVSTGSSVGTQPANQVEVSVESPQKGRTVTVLSSNYKIASQDVRTFLVEKELLESRCRKLQMEVSILQSDKKRLEEKNLLSQAKNSDLESKLTEATKELEITKMKLSQEVTNTTATNQAAMEAELEALKLNGRKLTTENERLKAELSSVKKLPESRRHGHVPTEITATLSAYKAESAALKAELAEVKALLQQSEAQVHSLEEQKRSAEASLVRLTKVKDFLDQSGGNGLGETAAEYMTKCLENRLKLTEERFLKERENMGNCLTKVEEKLLTQNSKLVTSEMELTRQLTLTKDRCRHLEEKTKELRELNLELRLALPLGSDILNSTRKSSYDLPHSIHSTIRAESKLMTTDVKEIMALVQRETGLCPGQETDMVCELWRRYEAAGHKLQVWRQYLFDLKISEGDITTGLQNLKEMKNQYDEKIRMAEEEVEEILNEKNSLESTYKKQVSELVKERHEAQAKMKTAEDLMAAMKAENEALKEDMLTREEALNQTISDYKAQVEELTSEKGELEVKVSQLTRTTRLQKTEIDRLEAELIAMERTLADMTEELEYTKQQMSDEEKVLQQQIDNLTEQNSHLETEVEVWQDKYQSLCKEKVSMEEKIVIANQEVVKSKAKSAEQDEEKTTALEHALQEHENEVKALTNQYQESEAELEKTKHRLLFETEHNADITKQLENLQQELKEKQKIAESQNMSEKEQLKQLNSLKEALEGVTQELHKSKARVKKLQVDLSQEKDKTFHLEDQLTKIQQEQKESEALQHSSEKVVPTMSPVYHSTPASTDLRIKDLEQERNRLKEELSHSLSSVEAQRGEITELRGQLSSLTQELILERETSSQLTADKSDLEQHLQCCQEDKDVLDVQKETCDRDLEKLEQCLHDLVTKFDLEARQRHGNFQRSYGHLGPEAQKLEEECLALRVLLEGKDAELGVLSDKLERQKQNMDFCRQKREMLLKENQCHRNDISNQSVQLSLKMKEMAAMMEVNQLLVSERTQLQMELHQAQIQLDRELEQHERRNHEVEQIINKFDASSESQKSAQHEVHKLENKIIALEADLRHANNTISQLGTENQQNKAKLERLNEDIRSLTNMNSTLEQRLEVEKHTVSENQSTISALQAEMKELTQKMDVLKHEKTLLMTSVESERKTAENLKTQLESKESELKQLRLDLDTHRGQLLVSRENYEKLSKEKQNIYADYQELCRQLNEKEKSLVENQAMFNSSMETIQRDFSLEKASLETDKSATIKEMEALRDEIRDLKEKLSQKEVQLCTFGRTLQELEEMTKQNQELEEKLQKMVTAAEESKILINSHRTENMTLRENLKDLEEKYAKLETAHRTLEEEFRAKRDNFSEQTLQFKHNIAEMKTTHEMEKFELKEKVARLESQLETAEASLKTLQGSHKDSVTNSHSLESSLQEVQAELHRAAVEKQVVSQKLAAIEEEYGKMKKKHEEFEVRARQALAAEAEKNSKLKKDFTDVQAAAYVHESNVKAKQDQVDMLQAELSKLRQVLETQRQQLASRFKKASFDFKQQSDNLELERKRLTGQLDQVTSDLEQAREQVSVKGRENLKLQEDLFSMEAQVREMSSKLRQAQDSLQHEEDLRQRAKDRNAELEEELKKVKSFVSKKVQDDGTGEVKMTWNDMNRFMQELNMKMDHLNAQKIPNSDNKDSSTVHRLRKQLAELQTELHTEKALHQITRSSLQASEDDCQRLRRQLRSKQRTSSVDEKSQKSRMEKINEIIAKSQTQAQLMMASGGYHDYSSRDVSLLTPRSGSFSPDNSLADHSALLNTSYNNNNPSSTLNSQHVASSTPEHK